MTMNEPMGILQKMMPPGGFILGMPAALWPDSMVKALNLNPATIAHSQQKMERARSSVKESREARYREEQRAVWMEEALGDKSDEGHVAELHARVGARGWHNAAIFGCASPLGQLIEFPERDVVKYSLYAPDCVFDYDPQLCTLQDSHEANANILGLEMKFRIDSGGLHFSAKRIPRNEHTDALIEHSYGSGGLRGLTCSLSCRVDKSHSEVYAVGGYPERKEIVQVIDAAFIQHVELIAPWRNAYPWEPRARAANTHARIEIYR